MRLKIDYLDITATACNGSGVVALMSLKDVFTTTRQLVITEYRVIRGRSLIMGGRFNELIVMRYLI